MTARRRSMSADEFARLLAPDLAGTFPRTAGAADGVDPAVAEDVGLQHPPPFIGQVDGMHPERLLEQP